MTETTETIPTPETRRLTRVRDGRWLGGVCTGLAGYFELNPMIYRIGFAALSLAGGTGILLYVAAWLVMPDEGVEDSIAADALKRHRDRPWLLVGVGLLAFGLLVGLSSAHVWPTAGNLWVAAALVGAALVWWQAGGRHDRPPAGRPVPRTPGSDPAVFPRGGPAAGAYAPHRRSLGPVAVGAVIAGLGIVGLLDVGTGWNIDWRIVIAAAAVALGALIAAGAATGHAVGSTVFVGVVVLAVLAVAVVVRVPLFAGAGDEIAHPASFSTLHGRYEEGIGRLNVELGDVVFPVGETHLTTTVGIGDLVVHVPRAVSVRVDGRATIGRVTLFGATDDGPNARTEVTRPGTDPTRVLVLDARVGIGRLEVLRG